MNTPPKTTRALLTFVGLLTIAFLGALTLAFAFLSLGALVSIFTEGAGAVGIIGALASAALAWITGQVICDIIRR